MKRDILFAITVIVFSVQTIFADNAFLGIRAHGKRMTPLSPISGEYDDPRHTVSRPDTDLPEYMAGGEVRTVLYFGDSIQIYGAVNGVYAGNAYNDILSDHDVVPDEDTFYALDGYAEALARIFPLRTLSLQGGMRHKLVYASGDYGENAESVIDQMQISDEGPRSYTYRQRATGYTGGINYIHRPLDVVYLNLRAGYTYYPQDNAEMEFELQGEQDDTNRCAFDLHEYEGSAGLRFLTPVDRMFEYEMGVKVSHSKYSIKNNNPETGRIYSQNRIEYYEFMPYIELIFPLF
ncbi:MAG: hypothetical protein ACOCWH_07140 [Spirochaetota bacterium]